MSGFVNWVEGNIGLKALISAGAVCVASYYYYYHYLVNKTPSVVNYVPPNYDSSQRNGPIRVKALYVYPIKSCVGVPVKSITLDKFGIVNDRRWMLVHNGRFMTQRNHPEMSQIVPEFSLDGKTLIIKSAKMPNDLHVPMDPQGGEKVKVTVWSDLVDAFDCGEQAHQWFSEFFGKDVRLVAMADDYKRRMKAYYFDNLNYQNLSDQEKDKYQTSFCDSSHVMVLAENSIVELNKLIHKTRQEKGEKQQPETTVANYRPNVLLNDSCFPFEEDSWKDLTISNVILKRVEHTPRCKFTTVDPNKGVIDPYGDNEPLRTMNRYKSLNGKPVFGILCIHEENAGGDTISIGDIVEKL
ncbi:hypothetical protein CYY_008038 [Polysphondylium violaceum]|uniref:MOSC domain-containing protein n=1 Tax=Polysphondylium violaceum TaxID=133409 RepID=A0A8J4PNS5_9MYCE|nr:hypothetical protein CYY_008038 [Polysphondylium violaceum]